MPATEEVAAAAPERTDGAAAQGAARLIEHTLELCRAARAAGLAVTPARVIDAMRALEGIDWCEAQDYRLALRVNLVSSPADEALFDRVFERHFGAPADAVGGAEILARSEMIHGELTHGRSREGHRDMLTDSGAYGPEEVGRRANLALRWDADAPPLAPLIRELARRLATRPSRRLQAGRRRGRICLRRSIRRNLGHGLDLIELARVRRRTRKTRLVMLCDVSGSMDAFNPFLLQLMLGLQQALTNSRTLVFSTRTTEISAQLRRRSVADTLAAVADTVRHWSGGTDIGAALAELNRSLLREGTARTTVLVVISDGYDNGDLERLRSELAATRRRIRTLVWINPMYGASTFAVRASGMRAALPYVDHFLPAFDARALRELVSRLGALG